MGDIPPGIGYHTTITAPNNLIMRGGGNGKYVSNHAYILVIDKLILLIVPKPEIFSSSLIGAVVFVFADTITTAAS